MTDTISCHLWRDKVGVVLSTRRLTRVCTHFHITSSEEPAKSILFLPILLIDKTESQKCWSISQSIHKEWIQNLSEVSSFSHYVMLNLGEASIIAVISEWLLSSMLSNQSEQAWPQISVNPRCVHFMCVLGWEEVSASNQVM